MLAVRRATYICATCRPNLAVSQLRNVRGLFTDGQRLRQATCLRLTSAANSQTCVRSQNRQISSTVPESEKAIEGVYPTSETTEYPTSALEANPEDAARRARQLFGDTLPRNYLSEDEFAVYERLYGTPVFVEQIEELEEVDGEQQEVFEAKMPDGKLVLLRTNEHGELEQVETYNQDNEIDLAEAEALEEEDEEEAMTEAEWEEYRAVKAQNYHQDVYEKSRIAQEGEIGEADEEEDADFMRAHPLTIAGRSKPSSATVFLPQDTFTEPVATLLTRANHKHLTESVKRIFGGPGLPHSATTLPARVGAEQKPITLDPSMGDMGNIEADAYLAAVMPGTYAAVMGTLVEVRRRLGSSWIERLLNRKTGPVVLDAGAGGAGILAWHQVLKAEWARMHEESGASSHGSAPLGKATVLVGADTLRHRASRLLENTTFIPRLPDAITEEDATNSQQPRKVYDLIIAPHTLWPLNQEHLRKEQTEKYWSLLNPKGGVLILIEKGLPRGFEVVAGARQLLLDKHIASPGSTEVEVPVEEQVSKPNEESRFSKKETGMIIAPCTNHSTCPMYQSPGISHGRKDFCYFNQRYIRPPFLQRILNAKDRNHEDIQFSYLAVQRGRDQRLPLYDPLGKGVQQDAETATRAFEGHEWNGEDELRTAADVNTLSLPRLILPALKRRGHITFDVCTPDAKLERWTVPRSFSKQAFRDARKARWGDLWALGAKTRTPRNVRLGRPRDEFDKKGRRIKAPKKVVFDIEAGSTPDPEMKARGNGRYTQDRKIRGSGGRKGRRKSIDLMNDLD
ncbi:hypothetical protein BU24DRAFT_417293 [Aaosphaeria arxii CBS 175.79]|uniref:37S ribosomal protein-like protein Rsm22 n=1 Tax=Aaosphaeria arxii CBS 175.79 TaxID=1450172 RepID=A0A6A5YA69_9PLEO|nr:uncharacterized protein BU24DRAFT_417293 [Aaosphaeria arxii CBS 175.79]KAF2021651.1 hypothetical protein BU24DRAFT_417293 [Aaosphaeria arxii CBS 175.79]